MNGRFTANDPRRNLKGRGKGGINLTDLVRKIGAEPVSRENRMLKMEAIIRMTFKAAFDGDPKAVEFIANRGWGQAVVPIETNAMTPIFQIVQPRPECPTTGANGETASGEGQVEIGGKGGESGPED